MKTRDESSRRVLLQRLYDEVGPRKRDLWISSVSPNRSVMRLSPSVRKTTDPGKGVVGKYDRFSRC